MAQPLSASNTLIGLTSSVALPANPLRHGCMFQNLSSTAIIALSLVEGEDARINFGIHLTPGGIWTMDEQTLTTGPVRAISSEADALLSLQEFN